MHERLAVIKKELMNNNKGPLGLVSDCVIRTEYQQRVRFLNVSYCNHQGMAHFHMLLWCPNAPKRGVDPDEEVEKYIDQFVTTEYPDPGRAPLMHQLVKKYQV